MSLLGEDIDQHGLAVHGVDNPVCLVDAAGPFAGEVVPELLRLSYAGVWMFCDVPEDFLYLFDRLPVGLLPLVEVFPGAGKEGNLIAHRCSRLHSSPASRLHHPDEWPLPDPAGT